jgi:polyhydroxyalkanoate synthesis regulator phasin
MTETRADLDQIGTFIEQMIRRERRVLLLRSCVFGAFALLGIGALMVLAALFQWDRSVATIAVVVLGGVGLWGAFLWPVLGHWSAAGDYRRQARRVEAAYPDLRGRLVTTVERRSGPVGEESVAMLELAARRAMGVVKTVEPSAIHSARPIVASLTIWAALVSVVVVLLGMVPGGSATVVRWWQAGFNRVGGEEALVRVNEGEHARVGDLVLRYTYPDYTGLEPKLVPNSTGDASGPPGTKVQVVARTAEPAEAAALVAYQEPALDAAVAEEGRLLTGEFTIQTAPGEYHLVLYQKGSPNTTASFAIEPEADLAPEVMIETEEDVIELALDQSFALKWRARDDFGIDRVGLRMDGQDLGRVLSRPTERRAEVWGEHYARPLELGLKPGDRVSLSVVAWDNDTYQGQKIGESRSIELVVLGPQGLDERAAERQLALRDLMLDVLADFLVEPWPPGETSGDMARWGEVVAKRYEPLETLAEEYWQGFAVESIEATMTAMVLDSGHELIRYSQVAFSPNSTATPKESAYLIVADMRTEGVEILEEAILALDRILRMRALREVAEQAETLENVASVLDELLEAGEINPQELLARLDQMERIFNELMEVAAKLSEGGLREFINARESEIQSLINEAREALSKGDVDSARSLMERLSEQVRQLSEGIKDNLEEMKSEGDDSMSKAKQLVEELQRIEDEQLNLRTQVAQTRQDGDASGADKASDLWEKTQAEARKLVEEGEGYVGGVEKVNRPFYEQQRGAQAVAESKALRSATEARDLMGALDALELTRRAWEVSERAYSVEQHRHGAGMPGPGERDLQGIKLRVQRLTQLLNALEEASRSVDSETASETRGLSDEQRQLKQDLEQAQQAAEQLVREFPVHPRGMEEALEGADDRMKSAGESLKRGQPLQAEGSQGVAAQRVREAKEALERAMRQAQQQARQLQSGGKGGGGAEGGKEQGPGGEQEQNTMNFDTFQLPPPEEFRSPEEYRRALIEGMEADVPDEFRSLKKRYYEELVQQ